MKKFIGKEATIAVYCMRNGENYIRAYNNYKDLDEEAAQLSYETMWYYTGFATYQDLELAKCCLCEMHGMDVSYKPTIEEIEWFLDNIYDRMKKVDTIQPKSNSVPFLF